MVACFELVFAEFRELQQERPQLFLQPVHPFNELREFGVTVSEHLFMSYGLRNLHSENEIWWCPSIPTVHGRLGRCTVVGRINLHGSEFSCVEGQILAGLHPNRIERAGTGTG